MHLTSFSQCSCNESNIILLLNGTGHLFTVTTVSIPDNSRWLLRKLSLIILFSLFLHTADLTRFPEIAIPRRGYCKPLALAMTVKQLSVDRHEERKTGLKSRGLVNLFV